MGDTIADWTSEQRDKAMKYGICRECGSPRDSWYIEETHPDGKVTAFVRMVCTKEPVKHPQH